MTKRTDVDFSKHELIVVETPAVTSHYLKKPNTITDSIKFINTNGILAVTGDYGNWIFCREFHPSPTSHVSGGYWDEKLEISSTQKSDEFNADKVKKEIKELKEQHELSEEELEWLDELEDEADEGEYGYIHKAWEHPSTFDTEMIPRGKVRHYWLDVIYDGFDEICNRMKEDKKKS